MGALGANVFEDDASMDWLEEYRSSGAGAVASALDTAAGTPVTDYLDVDQGAAARASAEVVAVAHGELPTGVSQDRLDLLNAHGSDVRAMPNIKSRATSALDRLISENSELHELWMESDAQSDWVAAMNDLRRRLR
ncbi:DUF4259 domain-containing protein [Maritimibacter sp. UBA3975]|uniref:DUF4259 domain-containing protein n=1 Tax=Maritimibacter sp. UBA3975 TaxID=1946833 RepID=UPI000C091A87|nr:DUF4259 domain-containing protein [Maritimibacter sp. UBA3975]MAM61719.1 hypothetical protein [Maritimibacter sp.]|tara:strand:- start:13555 stop:13962 length:408 start_codon:yes stop_codon:yes gene_type:complete